MSDRLSKWEKIERGYNGNNQKWKFKGRVFESCRASHAAYRWIFYELPYTNANQQIYTGVGDFRTVLKDFKIFIQNNIVTPIDKTNSKP